MSNPLLSKIDTFILRDKYGWDLIKIIDEALVCAKRRFEEFGIAKIDHVVVTEDTFIDSDYRTHRGYQVEAWGRFYEYK
jgi:hypothetical protein